MTGRTVWLASYPKSGNTWLRAVFTAWLTPGPVDVNRLVGNVIAGSRVAFDSALGIPSSSLTPDEIDSLRPRADEVLAADADPTTPYVRKVHDALFHGPGGEPIVSVAATRAALYVVRDPRAVAVSYAHQTGGDVDAIVRRLGDPDAAVAAGTTRLDEQLRQRLGTWSQHVRSWLDHAPFDVEAVRYEDLAAAPVETCVRALRFAGFGLVDETRVVDALERAAFDRLRRAEGDTGFRERLPGVAQFFRRGEADAWREELPGELAERIRQDHGEVMARFGYH